MTFDDVWSKVSKFTLLSREKALALYDFVIQSSPQRIIELGFFKGGSSLVLAAALDCRGGGSVVTLDLPHVRNLKPNIEELGRQLGLDRYIDARFCDWGYEWELGKLLYQRSNAGEKALDLNFDFAFIDGGHTWKCTGFAFYLVSALLNSEAWLLFDDLTWTIERYCPQAEWAKGIQEMRVLYRWLAWYTIFS